MEKLSDITFNELQIDGYERVVEVIDAEADLHAIIAIHSTTLGPAVGGIRVYPYRNFEEALTDVLRLSEGMTLKAAVTRSGTGGGKAVIIANNKLPKSQALLHAFAEAVNYLDGKYICAEDVGTRAEDVAIIHQKTKYVVGLPETSGNPSPFTAWGVFCGIQATAKEIFGSPSLEGKVIAIQGLGSVGMEVAHHLFWSGARLIVSDLDEKAVQRGVKDFGAKRVDPQEILEAECDILVPAALGGILNQDTIPKLRCQAVAGATNNQLLAAEDGDLLHKRGILYAPDFVINSGGLLNVCVEITKEGYNPLAARKKVNHIYDLLLEIFKISKERNLATSRVADEIALHNLEQEIGKRREEVVFHSKIC